MQIKALMVDVDGVIVTQRDPQGWLANLQKDLGVSAELLREKFFKPHFRDVLLGRAGLHERLALALAEIAPHLTPEELSAYWFKHDANLDGDLLKELAEFRSLGIELHLATVQEHRRAAYLWDNLGLRDRFDAIHYAADLGWVKPAPEFFAAIELRTRLRGPEIFFIDDKSANIEAARARGWRGAVWTGRQTLNSLIAEAAMEESDVPA